MVRVLREGALISGSKAVSETFVIDTNEFSTLSFYNKYTVAPSTAKTFDAATGVNTATEVITSTAHGFVTGRKIALTTAGVLPTGLSAGNYWVIKVSDDTLKLASSLSNAVAGTAVNITAAGTGTATMTPAALSGCSIKLQESNDDVEYDDITSMSTTITTDGLSKWKPDVSMRYIKISFAITDGQVNISSTVCGKG